MIRRSAAHHALTQEGGPRLRDYLNVIIRQRWLILLIFVTTVIGAICVFFLATPPYEATATLPDPPGRPGVAGVPEQYCRWYLH